MTNVKICRVNPAFHPKSGCGVSPQAVLDASRFQSSPSRLTIFHLNRISPIGASSSGLRLKNFHIPNSAAL